ADRGRADPRGVGAGGRLGHAHRLQPPFAARDPGQVVPLLRLRPMPQQGAHVVHLAVAGAGVAAAAVDLLHDDGCLREPEAGAAVLLRNQRREPAGPREGIDEGLGIGALRVHLAVVFIGEAAAEVAYGFADVLVAFRLLFHSWLRLLGDAFAVYRAIPERHANAH